MTKNIDKVDNIISRVNHYKNKYLNCSDNTTKKIYINIIRDLIDSIDVKIFFVVDDVIITNNINYN